MIVIDSKETQMIIRKDGVQMMDLFGESTRDSDKVKMGYAVFPPKTVVPWAAHDANEYSYVIKGSIVCETEEGINNMVAGCSGFIKAGEKHSSRNESGEDCHLIWILIQD